MAWSSPPVQSSTPQATASDATTYAQAFGSSVVSGNLLIVVIAWGTSSGQPSSITVADTLVSTWTQAVVKVDGTNQDAQAIAYAIAPSSGANTVTVTFKNGASTTSSSGGRAMALFEYSGNAASLPLDKSSSNNAAGSTSANVETSGSAITTTDGQLIVGGWADTTSGSSTLPTAGTGFVRRTTVATGAPVTYASEDETQTSAGSVAATWTGANTDRYIGLMATFKAPAAAAVLLPRPVIIQQAVNRASTY